MNFVNHQKLFYFTAFHIWLWDGSHLLIIGNIVDPSVYILLKSILRIIYIV